jgi:sec-independent protein translocase protein TatB
MGMPEMLLVGFLLLVFVGPEKLPEFMRTAGKYYGQVKRTADDLRRAFVMEADRMDAEDRYQKLQERRAAAEEARKKAMEQNPGATPQDVTIPPPRSPQPKVPDTDPESPAPPRPQPPSGVASSSGVSPPPGVSADEWATLPPHIQQMLAQVRAKPPAPPAEAAIKPPDPS